MAPDKKAAAKPPHPRKKKTSYQKFQDSMLAGMKDGDPDKWDHALRVALAEFDKHLGTKPGYKTPDARLLKAQMLTETGGPDDPSWETNPMQIGNPGDPGLAEVIDPQRLGEVLVRPPQLLADIKRDIASGQLAPENSIRAGICYILMLAVQAERQTIFDADAKTYRFTIKPGDTLEDLAKRLGTTQGLIKSMNPGLPHVLHPSEKKEYDYQKASIQVVITGFAMITPEFLMKKYNTGDALYSRKLHFALSLL